MNKVEVNNLEPYHINYVDASWLSIEKNAVGIFIDFTINAGDTVTHKFKQGDGDEPDTLIYYIKNHPNDLTGIVNYKNSLYKPTINASGLPLKIGMVVTDVNGGQYPKPDVDVYYTLGAYASNCENEYEINYASAPYAPYDPYKENRSVFIIINMDLHNGDIVCGSSFTLDGDSDNHNDTFTVNVISNENKDRPLMRYAGIFGPFDTHNLGVSLSTSVNGGKPAPAPVGIKSYGSEADKNIHQPA